MKYLDADFVKTDYMAKKIVIDYMKLETATINQTSDGKVILRTSFSISDDKFSLEITKFFELVVESEINENKGNLLNMKFTKKLVDYYWN